MMPITTCTSCEKAYEAWSEESANEPGRLCPDCDAGEAKDAALGLHDMVKDLEKENAALREFRCRTNDAFRAIQDDIHYSQKVKLETAIYGSFSCSHEDEANRRLEAVIWLYARASPQRVRDDFDSEFPGLRPGRHIESNGPTMYPTKVSPNKSTT